MLNYQSYSDKPVIQDELGFQSSVDAFLELISGISEIDTPITIGIFGSWGSGKTSLMQMILNGLDSDRFIPIWFSAWRYVQEETLWRALLICVVEGLRLYILGDDERLKLRIERKRSLIPNEVVYVSNEDIIREREDVVTQLDDLISNLYRSVEREELGGVEVNWGEAGKLVAHTALRVGFSFIPLLGTLTKAIEKAQEKIGEGDDIDTLFNIFQRERSKVYRDQIRSLEQFHHNFSCLVKEWVSDLNMRLIVFVDDLDRCLPEQAIGVVEAIKVFLDVQGCIFILGVDRQIIESGIRVRYKEFTLAVNSVAYNGMQEHGFPIVARDYLDKIVQIPFELPPLEASAIKSFLLNRLRYQENLDERSRTIITEIMTSGLIPNPRKIKRALNTFRLLLLLSKARGQLKQPELLAKLVVIQNSYPRIYEQVTSNIQVLFDLEKMINNGEYQNFVANKEFLSNIFPDNISYIDKMLKEPGVRTRTDVLGTILVRLAPRLYAMLKLDPQFASLDDEELVDLIFLLRATQNRILDNESQITDE